MIQVDATELKRLTADLQESALKAPAAVRPVVKRGATNIKAEAQRLASGLDHAPHYPRAITYDSTETRWGASAVIGPDKSRTQGALGNILEYGTSKNAPIPHLGPALATEAPRFEAALAAAEAAVLGG